MGNYTPQQRASYYDRVIKPRFHKRKDRLRRYMERRGCDTCGYNKHHSALQWDHRIPRHEDPTATKVGNMIATNSLKKIFEELRKCDLLCANCHAIRTHEDGHLITKERNMDNR